MKKYDYSLFGYTLAAFAILCTITAALLVGMDHVTQQHVIPLREMNKQLFFEIQQQNATIDSLRQELEEYQHAQETIEATGIATAEAKELAGYIVDYSRRNNLNPRVVLAVAHTESRFDRRAISHMGALGVMQVMPRIWGRRFEDECGYWYRGDARTNICIGVHILAQNFELTQDLTDALSMYYCGHPAHKSRVGRMYAETVLRKV